MSSSPPPPSRTNYNASDTVSYGTYNEKSNSDSNDKPLSLVEAMHAADIIRKVFLERKDPTETNQLVPPGTWQGVAAFAATGLLMTPFRRSMLQMAGPRGPFQGFVDLVVTPVLAVGAAQVGLVVGTLYGSGYYLDRVATEAATTTSSLSLGSSDLMSVRVGRDDKLSYSLTTANAAAKRESTVAELCKEVLSLSAPLSPPDTSTQKQSSSQFTTSTLATQSPRPGYTFGSRDPRTKTIEYFHRAIENCRRREY
mmetsp:Transcript_26697/g.57256  ORF Transcript_26697/g.57256 Transcript_26697/m.57256 type:complete len:254 (-) Transcript_26697:3080-3841(-)